MHVGAAIQGRPARPLAHTAMLEMTRKKRGVTASGGEGGTRGPLAALKSTFNVNRIGANAEKVRRLATIRENGAIQRARVAHGGAARTTGMRPIPIASSDRVRLINGGACAESDFQRPFGMMAPMVLNASSVQQSI
jgi:hypothetical protein